MKTNHIVALAATIAALGLGACATSPPSPACATIQPSPNVPSYSQGSVGCV